MFLVLGLNALNRDVRIRCESIVWTSSGEREISSPDMSVLCTAVNCCYALKLVEGRIRRDGHGERSEAIPCFLRLISRVFSLIIRDQGKYSRYQVRLVGLHPWWVKFRQAGDQEKAAR